MFVRIFFFIFLYAFIAGCSDQKYTLKVIITNPDLKVKSIDQAFLTTNPQAVKGSHYFWDNWFITSYNFKDKKPAQPNIFYLENIKKGTYYLQISVKAKDKVYIGKLNNLNIDTDTVTAEVQIAPIRRFYDFSKKDKAE